jgi:hypothetical protein
MKKYIVVYWKVVPWPTHLIVFSWASALITSTITAALGYPILFDTVDGAGNKIAVLYLIYSVSIALLVYVFKSGIEMFLKGMAYRNTDIEKTYGLKKECVECRDLTCKGYISIVAYYGKNTTLDQNVGYAYNALKMVVKYRPHWG